MEDYSVTSTGRRALLVDGWRQHGRQVGGRPLVRRHPSDLLPGESMSHGSFQTLWVLGECAMIVGSVGPFNMSNSRIRILRSYGDCGDRA